MHKLCELSVEQLSAAGAVPHAPLSPYDMLLEEDRAMVIQLMLSEMIKPRWAKVIRMRFGLRPYDRVYALREVAQELKVTHERIRQIEGRGLRLLRESPFSVHLRELVY